MIEKSKYEQLAAIDVTAHIEKKGTLSYLSWAWAVDQLLRTDPAANWSYNAPMEFGDTMMVSCTVTAFGKPMTMHLPVMDYKNKAIHVPNSFDINTAMMRCLVKCIALHGLGLYIYAGEDLPLGDEIDAKAEYEDWLAEKANLMDMDGNLDPAIEAAAWKKKSSKVRSAIKAYGTSIKENQ